MTREELEAEIKEKTADLEVFTTARTMIRDRVLELVDSKNVLTPLPQWSGTDAVLGTLDLVIHSIERTLDECKMLVEMEVYFEEEKKPKLYLVKDEEKN